MPPSQGAEHADHWLQGVTSQSTASPGHVTESPTMVSATPQPHTPASVFPGSAGHPSLQFGVPSLSESVSATPHPHTPAATFAESSGQSSLQSGVLSLSESVSATPHPHVPAATLFGSLGHPSDESGVPSLSLSTSLGPSSVTSITPANTRGRRDVSDSRGDTYVPQPADTNLASPHRNEPRSGTGTRRCVRT